MDDPFGDGLVVEEAGECGDRLQVERGRRRWRENQNDDANGFRRPAVDDDRLLGYAERHRKAVDGLGAVVREERARPDLHGIARAMRLHHAAQCGGIAHGAGFLEPGNEQVEGLTQRGRAQRHDDVLARKHLGEQRAGRHRPQSTAWMRPTTSLGFFATPMPWRSNVSIFSAAVPSLPLMIAPACPMRRPGGAVCPAMKPTTGLVILELTNSAACCSSVPPISPIMTTAFVSGSFSNASRQSMKFVPLIGSPPMPTHVLWPIPAFVSW